MLLSDLSGFLPSLYKAQGNEVVSLTPWQVSCCTLHTGRLAGMGRKQCLAGGWLSCGLGDYHCMVVLAGWLRHPS